MKRNTESTPVNPDIARWNRKYENAGTARVAPEGEPELVALSDRLDNRGLALDMAAGRGRNALYLATLGYRVIACDGAVSALVGCAGVSRDSGLPVYCMACDLESYRFGTDLFDLLVVVRYLNRPLLPVLPTWIRPGGWLFYKTFNTRFLETNPRFNPAYTVEPGELNEMFSGLDIRASDTDRTTGTVSDNRFSFVLARKSSAVS